MLFCSLLHIQVCIIMCTFQPTKVSLFTRLNLAQNQTSMASHFQSILLFVVLNILLIQPYNLNPCYAQIISNPIQKVDLTLYYETLCPYCSYFIAHHLVTLFTDDLISMVNLRLVPWGNSLLLPSGYFQCQVLLSRPVWLVVSVDFREMCYSISLMIKLNMYFYKFFNII